MEEDLDHFFWECQYEWFVWSSFLREFSFAGQRSVRTTIEEFLLHPPFKEKGHFLRFARVGVVIWDIFDERNERNDLVFTGKEKNHEV